MTYKSFHFLYSAFNIQHLSFLFALIFIAFVASVAAQPLPSDTWLVRNVHLLHDLGMAWDVNTSFKPYRMERLASSADLTQKSALWPAQDVAAYGAKYRAAEKKGADRLRMALWPGFLGQITSADPDSQKMDFASAYLVNQFHFRNFYAEWHLRATSDPNSLEHYTAYPRDIKRIGFNSAEFDQASLGYQGKHGYIQYGRGRQIWGPRLVENLALSSHSAAYEHLTALLDYKRFSAIFFTGFLESIKDGLEYQNRYIAGHGVQYNNHRNFWLSLAEVTVYYGPNRPFDLAYLNPLTPHIETELNNRENNPYRSGNHSNGVYFLSADWLGPARIRLSGSVLLDEFQLDEQDRDEGRPDATALLLRGSKGFLFANWAAVLHASYQRVGTFTFQHENAYTVLFSRGLPLGIPDGNDFEALQFGVDWIAPFPALLQASYRYKRLGENNLLSDPYRPFEAFVSLPFPSGDVIEEQTLELSLLYAVRSNLDIEMHYQRKTFQWRQEDWTNTYLAGRINMHLPMLLNF